MQQWSENDEWYFRLIWQKVNDRLIIDLPEESPKWEWHKYFLK